MAAESDKLAHTQQYTRTTGESRAQLRDEKHAFHVEVWKQGALPMEPLTVRLCFQKHLHQISTGPAAMPPALSLSKLCAW
jgi:hypothetical protein